MNKVILLLLLLLPMLCTAQRWGGPQISPDSSALRQTTVMTDSLTLSAAQAKKIHEVNLDFAHQLKAARDKYAGDRENMRPAMQALRKAQQTAWSKFLTSDQLAQWQGVMQRQREKRRGNRPNNKRRGSQESPPQKNN